MGLIDRDYIVRELMKRLAAHAETTTAADYARIEELCWLINWAITVPAPAPNQADAQSNFNAAMAAAQQLNPYPQKLFGT